MNFIQGRYTKTIESSKGKLQGLQIKTEQGKQKVYLPKSLRAIAQAELVLDRSVRIWIDSDRSSKKRLYALQLVPLAPKPLLEKTDSEPADKRKTKKKKSKVKKSQVTVQICQKKNCCKKGGDDLWRAFKTASFKHEFKLEPIGCLGGCKRGPNIRLLPDNVKYRHVQLAEVDNILQTHGPKGSVKRGTKGAR